MDPSPHIIYGTILSAIVAIGSLIARDRQTHKAISDGDSALHKALIDSDNALHARITKMQEKYVHQGELSRHTQGIETQLTQIREEQRETNRRIDHVLTALTPKE